MQSRQQVKQLIRQNTHALDLLSEEMLIKEWEGKTGREIKEIALDTTNSLKKGAGYVPTVLDANTALKLIKDLGFNGKVVTKIVNGKNYIIFKGYAGSRSLFTGTRYIASNPKVVDMAIGRMGAAKSVASGARITIFLVVPLNVLRFILDDHQTMFHLIGNITSDLVKVGIASAFATVAGVAAASIMTLAAGPLIVTVVIGVATGLTLDYLDHKFGVTEKLINSLEEGYDNSFGALGRVINKIDRTLRWQALNGISMGKGMFY
jgi:hypothetical protein